MLLLLGMIYDEVLSYQLDQQMKVKNAESAGKPLPGEVKTSKNLTIYTKYIKKNPFYIYLDTP